MRDFQGSAEMALAFAEAVARPGGNALLLDENNRPSDRRWVPIREAVESGRAFAVEPCDNVLAIDIDEDPDRSWANAVRDGLTRRGFAFVEVESGRSGHGHLWVLGPAGWDHAHIKAEAERVAGAPPDRRQIRTSATRPPYAPHRLGRRSRVVDPGPATALDLFRSARSQGVPDGARYILRWLDPTHVVRTTSGKVDRGRSINKAALQMINARCTFAEFLAELEARPNEVTSKYLELPSAARTKFALKAWQDALRHVRENPPSDATRRKVEGLMASVGQRDWPARTVNTDLPVYEALLEIAHRAAKLTVDASVRDLSERAGVGTGSVSAALQRLTDRRLISPVHDRRSRHLSKAYRLLWNGETYALGHTTVLLGGPRAVCGNERTFLTDVFSNRSGLGNNARLVWEALTETPSTKADISVRLRVPLPDRTVGDALRKLATHGFATKHGHRWAQRMPTRREIDLTLDHLGVRGKGERRRTRHERERDQFRDTFGVIYDLPDEPAADPDQEPAA